MDKRDFISQDIEQMKKGEQITIKPNNKILFIGDSITDADRNHNEDQDLGQGYPLLLGAYLLNKYPAYNLQILNRGIGGDCIADLKSRWEEDCLELNPEIVSILIGVNDVWHEMNTAEKLEEETLQQFEADYRWLLKMLAHRTDARVVLMEPYVLPYPKDRVNWRKHLDPRIQIVRHLANEYHAALIPLDGVLNTLGVENGFQTYTGDDGVHPTLTGHAAIAETWINYLDV